MKPFDGIKLLANKPMGATVGALKATKAYLQALLVSAQKGKNANAAAFVEELLSVWYYENSQWEQMSVSVLEMLSIKGAADLLNWGENTQQWKAANSAILAIDKGVNVQKPSVSLTQFVGVLVASPIADDEYVNAAIDKCKGLIALSKQFYASEEVLFGEFGKLYAKFGGSYKQHAEALVGFKYIWPAIDDYVAGSVDGIVNPSATEVGQTINAQFEKAVKDAGDSVTTWTKAMQEPAGSKNVPVSAEGFESALDSYCQLAPLNNNNPKLNEALATIRKTIFGAISSSMVNSISKSATLSSSQQKNLTSFFVALSKAGQTNTICSTWNAIKSDAAQLGFVRAAINLSNSAATTLGTTLLNASAAAGNPAFGSGGSGGSTSLPSQTYIPPVASGEGSGSGWLTAAKIGGGTLAGLGLVGVGIWLYLKRRG